MDNLGVKRLKPRRGGGGKTMCYATQVESSGPFFCYVAFDITEISVHILYHIIYSLIL